MRKNSRIDITFSQAINLIESKRDIVIIDVKSTKEYQKFHLDNSINIPIENIKEILPKRIQHKNQRIVVYCSSGVRSIAACEIMSSLGYKNIYNIKGGV